LAVAGSSDETDCASAPQSRPPRAKKGTPHSHQPVSRCPGAVAEWWGVGMRQSLPQRRCPVNLAAFDGRRPAERVRQSAHPLHRASRQKCRPTVVVSGWQVFTRYHNYPSLVAELDE
jgi:hypothetical protein